MIVHRQSLPSPVRWSGDVGQPQLVRSVGVELVPDPTVVVDHGAQVVVDRRPGFLAVPNTLHQPMFVTRIACCAGHDTGSITHSPQPGLLASPPCKLRGSCPVSKRVERDDETGAAV